MFTFKIIPILKKCFEKVHFVNIQALNAQADGRSEGHDGVLRDI